MQDGSVKCKSIESERDKENRTKAEVCVTLLWVVRVCVYDSRTGVARRGRYARVGSTPGHTGGLGS